MSHQGRHVSQVGASWDRDLQIRVPYTLDIAHCFWVHLACSHLRSSTQRSKVQNWSFPPVSGKLPLGCLLRPIFISNLSRFLHPPKKIRHRSVLKRAISPPLPPPAPSHKKLTLARGVRVLRTADLQALSLECGHLAGQNQWCHVGVGEFTAHFSRTIFWWGLEWF